MTINPLLVPLPDGPRTLQLARELVYETFQSWGYARGAADDAAVIASELATNALRYSEGAEPYLEVKPGATGALIQVWDGSMAPPVMCPMSETAESGRGLQIVDSLAAAWGHYPSTKGGKYVYALIKL